jgi:hypothetical protein
VDDGGGVGSWTGAGGTGVVVGRGTSTRR